VLVVIYMAAVISLKDRSLYERLQRLLPRPDYPWDELLKKLIEQPGRIHAEKLADIERRLADLDKRVSELGASFSELREAVKALASAVAEIKKVLEAGALCNSGPYFAVLVPARFEDSHVAQPVEQRAPASQGDAEAVVTGDEVYVSPVGSNGAGGVIEMYVEEARRIAESNGGCLRFSELARRFGRDKIGGWVIKALLRRGFVKKEPGLYCLPTR
jgi:hypothetical protein